VFHFPTVHADQPCPHAVNGHGIGSGQEQIVINGPVRSIGKVCVIGHVDRFQEVEIGLEQAVNLHNLFVHHVVIVDLLFVNLFTYSSSS
jgi:hypothetical protein